MWGCSPDKSWKGLFPALVVVDNSRPAGFGSTGDAKCDLHMQQKAKEPRANCVDAMENVDSRDSVDRRESVGGRGRRAHRDRQAREAKPERKGWRGPEDRLAGPAAKAR